MKKNNLTKLLNILMRAKFCHLISDAGTPLLSDPGRVLVNQCVEN